MRPLKQFLWPSYTSAQVRRRDGYIVRKATRISVTYIAGPGMATIIIGQRANEKHVLVFFHELLPISGR